MMRHSRSFYLSLLFLTLSALAIIWFDYKILFNSVIPTSDRIVGMRRETQFLRARMQYLPFIKNEELRMLKEQENLKMLQPFSTPLEFLYFLEETAKLSGSQIRVNVQEGKVSAFKVELSGSFNNLLHFLIRVGLTPTNIQLSHIMKKAVNNERVTLITNLTLIPSL